MKFIFFFLFSILIRAQNIISGNITSENNFILQNVTVINMKTGYITNTDNKGNFQILAKTNDELRFSKGGFERNSKIIESRDLLIPLSIQLIHIPLEIKEVKIRTKPTGNLKIDANRIKIDHTKEILQKEIGLPQPKGIQREKVPVLTKDILLPLATARLNIDAIYKVISGDARRMKNIYKFEDMQRSINWIAEHNGEEYFTERGIPKEKITEFIEFSILVEPKISQYIKLNNISAVNFILEETALIYLERLKK